MKSLVFASAWALISILSCSADLGRIEGWLDGARVQVAITRVAKAEADASDAIVYGRVAVAADRRIEAVNLNCISLAFGKLRASKIYVDRIAHVLPDSFRANDNGKVNVSVYWLFPESRPRDLQMDDAAIFTDGSGPGCVTYAGA